jgi:hypothetical protein
MRSVTGFSHYAPNKPSWKLVEGETVAGRMLGAGQRRRLRFLPFPQKQHGEAALIAII